MKQTEKWQKDLAVYQNINTTFIIEGNVHDLQPWIHSDDNSCEPVTLSAYLYWYLAEQGYHPIVFYNRIDGFSNPYEDNMKTTFFHAVDSDAKASKSLGTAIGLIRKAIEDNKHPSAVIVDMANTITTTPDSLSEEELEYFTTLMLASKKTVDSYSIKSKQSLMNLLFLVVDKVNDIPTWFYLNNPYVRTITISKPSKTVRTLVIDEKMDVLTGIEELSVLERKKKLDEFVSLTDGMTLVEIFGVFSLCQKKGYGVLQIKDAIKLFRYGETESHWDKLDAEQVKKIECFLREKVRGQNDAISKASDVIRRACQGMSGMQGGSNSRPKGVLFFAGPTGTGKTELAKTISEFVFGDESFLTRFDMSEYQQPHSDQKLLGAPPGYVGYSEGGQLTNAVKEKPFCVLLFDEIEKAHPSIMDKFLQILEDGRITDSAGETMYFSEALIIFTSNLGVSGHDEKTGNHYDLITPDMDYSQIQSKLMLAIKNFFKYTIQRPELLNRMGDNFVIFDFIREEAADEILDLKLSAVKTNMEQKKGVKLCIEEPFVSFLREHIRKDMSNGGRGISNMVETYLLNPLSKVLFDESCQPNDCVVIESKPDNESNVFRYHVVSSS